MYMFVATLVILAAVLVYFLPAMIAVSRDHLNTTSVFLTNLLLGWTGLGWVFALIWAFTNNPAAAGETRPAIGLGKFVLLLFLFFVVPGTALFWVKGYKPPAAPEAVRAPVSAPAPAAPAPEIKTGVPVPADELLGK